MRTYREEYFNLSKGTRKLRDFIAHATNIKWFRASGWWREHVVCSLIHMGEMQLVNPFSPWLAALAFNHVASFIVNSVLIGSECWDIVLRLFHYISAKKGRAVSGEWLERLNYWRDMML